MSAITAVLLAGSQDLSPLVRTAIASGGQVFVKESGRWAKVETVREWETGTEATLAASHPQQGEPAKSGHRRTAGTEPESLGGRTTNSGRRSAMRIALGDVE